MTGYKGFDKDLKCRDVQYHIGKTKRHTGKIELCAGGLHFCENPLDIFNYYPPAHSRFAEVKATGVSKETREDDSKRVARSLKVTAELSLHNLANLGAKFILSKVDFDNAKESNTGDHSAATNTGDYSAATNAGDQSAATNTGNYSAATMEGKHGVAIVTGLDSSASGVKTSWLVLTERHGYEKDYAIKEIRAVKVDGKTIKEYTMYALKNGEVVEA